MSEEKTVVRRAGKVVKGMRRIGLLVVGLVGYVGILVALAVWCVWTVSTGRTGLAEAVTTVTIANAVVHTFVAIASV